MIQIYKTLATQINRYIVCTEKICSEDRTRDVSQKKILCVTAAVRLANRE